MNLHEYQGKELLSKHGVRIQRGYVAHTVAESITGAEKIYNETNNIIRSSSYRWHATQTFTRFSLIVEALSIQ